MNVQKISIYSTFPLLLLSAFISGGGVMVAELTSAKLISNYYGNSLYVWSAVLAITLGGLAAGYFFGGYFSSLKERSIILRICLLITALLMFFMPFIASLIMEITINISMKSGIVVSCLVFLFPVLFCFGMVSPLIIGVIEQRINQPGIVSSIVYSVSTIGGILLTFLTGYFFIPLCGLENTCLIIGCLLGLAFILTWLGTNK